MWELRWILRITCRNVRTMPLVKALFSTFPDQCSKVNVFTLTLRQQRYWCQHSTWHWEVSKRSSLQYQRHSALQPLWKQCYSVFCFIPILPKTQRAKYTLLNWSLWFQNETGTTDANKLGPQGCKSVWFCRKS